MFEALWIALYEDTKLRSEKEDSLARTVLYTCEECSDGEAALALIEWLPEWRRVGVLLPSVSNNNLRWPCPVSRAGRGRLQAGILLLLRLVQTVRVNLLCRQHNTKETKLKSEKEDSRASSYYTCEERCQSRLR